jgi:hypothetical protein
MIMQQHSRFILLALFIASIIGNYRLPAAIFHARNPRERVESLRGRHHGALLGSLITTHMAMPKGTSSFRSASLASAAVHSGEPLLTAQSLTDSLQTLFTAKYDSKTFPAWMKMYYGGIDTANDAIISTGVRETNLLRSTVVTTKFTSEGDSVWTTVFTDSGDFGDYPTAFCIDYQGNTCVAVKQGGSGNLSDFCIIKIDKDGRQQWIAYDTTNESEVRLLALGSDNTGAIYGACQDQDQKLNLLKYSSSGVLQWRRRYEHYLPPKSLLVDPRGNIDLLAGLLLQFNSNGDLQWEANSWITVTSPLAMDGAGNLFVGGKSQVTNLPGLFPAVASISASGSIQWTTFDTTVENGSVAAITTGKDGNIFANGECAETIQPAALTFTMKLNALGRVMWTVMEPRATRNLSANFMLCGGSDGTVYSAMPGVLHLYNQMGWRLVSNQPLGSPVTLGFNRSNSFVFLANDLSDSVDLAVTYTIASLSPAGILIWSHQVHGEVIALDEPRDITTDQLQNTVVVTSSLGRLDRFEILITKFDPYGNPLWGRRYASPNAYFMPYDIVTDNGDNIVISAVQGDSANAYGTIILKYSPTGDLLWVQRFDTPGLVFDYPSTLNIGPGNSVLISGYADDISSPSREMKMFVLAYTADGTLAWSYRYDNPDLSNYPIASVCDSAGNFYIACSAWNDSIDQILTMKITNNGVVAWEDRQGSGPIAMLLAPNGNIYILDERPVPEPAFRRTGVIGYSPSGSRIAMSTDALPCLSPYADGWVSFINDDAGGFYVGGTISTEMYGVFDHLELLRLDSTGHVVWCNQFKADQFWAYTSHGIVKDRNGIVYFSGSGRDAKSKVSSMLTAFSPEGVMWARASYRNTEEWSEYPIKVAIDEAGNPVILAQSYAGENRMAEVLKYAGLSNDNGVTCHYETPWKLVSVPSGTPNKYFRDFIPSATGAFGFSGSGYTQTDTLSPGSGYWVKSSGSQTITLNNSPTLPDTLDARQGWNLIGVPSLPVAIQNIASIPPGLTATGIFGYNGRYANADVLVPGRGYWIKMDSPGKLILSPHASGSTALNKISLKPSGDKPPAAPADLPGVSTDLPKNFRLDPPSPNPFNPSTSFRYALPAAAEVRLGIYNTLGQCVCRLIDKTQDAGSYTVGWNAAGFASGVYFFRMDAVGVDALSESYHQTGKLLLLK